MNKILSIFILFTVLGSASARINFSPIVSFDDISIDTLVIEGIEYHKIIIDGFPLPVDNPQNAGMPSIPFVAPSFLLHPNLQINSISVLSSTWEPLPGKYYLYPAQTGMMTDTVFVYPDSTIYNSSDPYPSEPVEIIKQGSAMGYSVITLSGTPVRYIPADSTLELLTKVTLHLSQGPAEFERVVPNRETEWSAALRERGVLSLVANPEDMVFYQNPNTISFEDRTSPLNILDSPSLEGDGVDMVIITSGPNGSGPDMTSAFQDLADYRTAQGIITVIRTVDWIDNLYSGCDTPEKIRNFIRDAHEQWGVQAVLLGGDDWVVPIRECYINSYKNYFPADDYYADIDGDWKYYDYPDYYWQAPDDEYWVDLTLGRWPVDNAEDVELLLCKLQHYETLDDCNTSFAREMTLLGGIYPNRLEELADALEDCGVVYENLNTINEMYPYNDLNRETALGAFSDGYNIIIHSDHCGTSEIGVPRDPPSGPSQFLYDFDFGNLTNQGESSIFWTLGCWPGHFEGAECFAEAGLLTDDNTGFIAAIANARSGAYGDWVTYFSFIDALYPFGWADYPRPGGQPNNCPVSNIGEAYRYSMNRYSTICPTDPQSHSSLSFQNLFGDPSMFVWRDEPHQLGVETVPSIITAGTSTDITVSVTDEDDEGAPIAAKVCLYKDGDLFAIRYTDAIYGTTTFNDVQVAHAGSITVTAVKRREITGSPEAGVCNFIPGEYQIIVSNTLATLINLEGFIIDDDDSGQSEGNGDGIANPGETIELDLDVSNLGMAGATRLRAQLSVVSGDVQIEDGFEFIGILAGLTNVVVQDAFVVSIPADLDENEPVQLEVTFTCDQGSWESPCDFTVLVDDIVLPLHSIDVKYSGGITTVTVSNILAVNTGIGAAEDIEITLDSFSHGAVFTSDVSVVGDIEPGTSVAAPSLTVTCNNPPLEWQDPYSISTFPYCSFEIIATDRYDREIYSEVISVPNYDPEFRPVEPNDLEAVEAGQDYINVEWDRTASFNGNYYLYLKEGTSDWIRSNLLPIPVLQYKYSGLESATVYELGVAAVDEYGQESPLCEMTNSPSTVCHMLSGWPVQLEGGTGSGPLVVDIVGDGSPEIVAVTDFGNAYILSTDGQPAADLPSTQYRYTGCAVGNMDNDSQLEIVVACQVDITAGIAGIVIYDLDESSDTWHAELVCETGEIEESYETFGTPVLVQANASVPLEIALRTRSGREGYNYSRVHVWRLEALSQEWIEFSSAFPVTIYGGIWHFTPPVSSDWDDDGYIELLVASNNSNGEPCIFSIDIDQTATLVEFNLKDDIENDYSPYSSIATLNWAGDDYLVGVARSGDDMKVFTLNLDTGNTDVSGKYVSDQFNGLMGGPAIGDYDGDGEPDIVFALNSMRAWDLGCNIFPDQGNLEYNPHDEDGGDIRSPSIFVGGNSPLTLVGYSTKFYMHDVQDGMSVEEGFPSWTEDKAWAAPLVADLDEDGFLEVLAVDNSGYMCVFDWNGSGNLDEGWPMFQHDRLRSGNYNTQFLDCRGGDLDFRILDIRTVNSNNDTGISHDPVMIAEVEVSGSGRLSAGQVTEEPSRVLSVASQASIEPVSLTRIPESGSSLRSIVSRTAPTVVEDNWVEVAIYYGSRRFSSSHIPLEDGVYSVELPMNDYRGEELIIIVDPSNRYREIDETNNTVSGTDLAVFDVFGPDLFVPSPSSCISLSFNLEEALLEGPEVRVYSIEGRLVIRVSLDAVESGSWSFEIAESGALPSGLYTVIIDYQGGRQTVTRVVVLD